MTEHNEQPELKNSTFVPVVVDSYTVSAEQYEQAVQEIKRLDGVVTQTKEFLDATRWQMNEFGGKLDAVTKIIQDAFDEGGWDENDKMLQELKEHLEIDLNQTEKTDVTVTATWTVTVTHKKGEFDVSLIEADVDAPDLTTYGDDYEFGYPSFEGVEVEEA